ncbi:MAG: hypothetical protein CVU39_00640 [Chloroflexi bacterium HGW-Chloroflexi-10]|nr:MAG: hypothetical protein CVU39_00640 [Chloroflexi bacterium HGW-Chloroflexi-10]
MNAELAQIITLVAHGNLFLRSGKTTAADLSSNPAFQYVSAVKFARYQNKQEAQGKEAAGSVSEWFAFLRLAGVTRLWQIAFQWERKDIPEHVAAGFAGGVPNAIQADLPNGFELWYPKWETGGPKEKPWSVEYRALMFPYSHAVPPVDLDLVKIRLGMAIAQALEFSSKQPAMENGYWIPRFTEALALLNSTNLITSFPAEILPESGYCLEARQILAAAAQAYVFGGMGSWNDMGFSDPALEKEYERISTELYEAIKMGTTLATNSFALEI